MALAPQDDSTDQSVSADKVCGAALALARLLARQAAREVFEAARTGPNAADGSTGTSTTPAIYTNTE